MANYTGPGRTWKLDTAGIITEKPVLIQKAIIYPNSAGDSALFVSWDNGSTPTQTKTNETMTSVNGQEFESTGNWPTTTINPGQIVKFTGTSTGNNERTFLIATNADNNNITVDAAQDPTEEDGKIYNWKVYEPVTEFKIQSPGTEVIAWEIDFAGHGHRRGRYFPNLAMDDLSASAVVHLFIG